MSILSRLKALEAKRGAPARIWVSYDDGPYKSFSEELGRMEELTREELDARRAANGEEAQMIHVIYVDTAEVNND